ncbi:MAG: NAD(P)-binding domain-containing protein [Planctomycetes bacterium]|nr:NAD(P)-binding domain-containing protein [Planctomycetota bacterium]
MKVGIFGTGDVGRALGNGFIALGHDVMMGSRKAGGDKAKAWVAEAGAKASEGTFADAARFGELAVIATLGTATEEVLKQAGATNLKGKILWDATNPLDFSGGMPPRLAITGYDSLGERVQKAVPEAHVVKVFNTVGNALMFKPELKGGPPTMFIAGNDEGAKVRTKQLLTDFGWETSDIGGIEGSRYLEAMCLTWVLHGINSGGWLHAFKLLSR